MTPLPDERNPRWVRFGDFLKELRADRTQEVAGRLIGMTAKQLSRIENGASGTKYDTIGTILSAYDIRPSDPRHAKLYELAGFDVKGKLPADPNAVVLPPLVKGATFISPERGVYICDGKSWVLQTIGEEMQDVLQKQHELIVRLNSLLARAEAGRQTP